MARRPATRTLLLTLALCVATLLSLAPLPAGAQSSVAQSAVAQSAGVEPTPPAHVVVDLAQSLGPWQPVTAWFGYDELNYTTTPAGRALLGELAQAYQPVPVYVRAHHLFTTGDGQPALKWSSTGVYSVDAAGHPAYDFRILDRTFDAWLAAGVRPMVELGFMPQALARDPGPYELAYPHTIEGSVQSPPSDFAAWGELCRVFTAHLVARYGAAQVATWYFEVWNEPNIRYWHGTRQQYFQLYDYAVAGVRAALPQARVGGPATTSPRSPAAAAFLAAFLDHIAHDRSAANGQPLPLDFITFHAKGTPRLIHEAAATTHVRMGLASELTDADKGFALIASYPQFRQLPIILSEADPEGCAACSAAENPANGYRNGPLYGAYTAEALRGFLALQDRYHVHLAGMLSWSFEFEGRQFFEGFRTLATNGVDKPVLNALRETALLDRGPAPLRVTATSSAAQPVEAELHSGVPAPVVDVLATRSAHSATVLLWSYQDDDLPDAPAAPVQLAIEGLPAALRHVTAHLYRVDRTHGNAFTLWQSMGRPQQPTPAQLQQLIAAGHSTMDAPQLLQLDAAHGHAMLPLELPAQATWALTLDLP